MTKYEIINNIAKNNTVEKMVYKMLPASKNRFDCPDDLVQDIYVLLLSKNDELIKNLDSNGELGYYILKIVKNQLLSANSPYFCLYIKHSLNNDDLDKAKDILTED